MEKELDLMTYETLGRLFAHLSEGFTPDVERMREIKNEYEAKKAAILEARK